MPIFCKFRILRADLTLGKAFSFNIAFNQSKAHLHVVYTLDSKCLLHVKLSIKITKVVT